MVASSVISHPRTSRKWLEVHCWVIGSQRHQNVECGGASRGGAEKSATLTRRLCPPRSVIEGNNYRALVLFPFQYNGQVRVTLDAGPLGPGEEVSKIAAEMTIDKFEAMVSECIAPSKFKVLEHTWLTCYGINERRAPTFQHQGRIFLTGDAAHVHSPAGGQGMNTGLQDASNLAWKLALVLRRVAPASLLDTYTPIRTNG